MRQSTRCSMLTVKPILQIDTRLADQIIRPHQIPVQHLHMQHGVLRKRRLNLEALAEHRIQLLAHIVLLVRNTFAAQLQYDIRICLAVQVHRMQIGRLDNIDTDEHMNGIVGGQRRSESGFQALGHRYSIHLQRTLEVANDAIVVFGRVAGLFAAIQWEGQKPVFEIVILGQRFEFTGKYLREKSVLI